MDLTYSQELFVSREFSLEGEVRDLKHEGNSLGKFSIAGLKGLCGRGGSEGGLEELRATSH